MGINRIELKKKAKVSISDKSNGSSILLFSIVFIAIRYILNSLSANLTGIKVDMDEYAAAAQNLDTAYFTNLVTNYQTDVFSVILDIAIKVILLILTVGFIIFLLNVINKKKTSFGNLFDGFNIFDRAVILYILIYVKVLLWSLLFIIPGIIAQYRYRLAKYIMIEHPELTPRQCIDKSKELMHGHKGELFCLDLSFIGWYILTAIPFVSIYVYPYTQLTYAHYYNQIATNNGFKIVETDFEEEI